MIRLLTAVFVALIAAGCATKPPAPPPDPVSRLLEANETIALRIPAQLMHGHDMQEPEYDAREGYRPIPTYQGELALTDRRLLFVEQPAGPTSGWLSIPYEAVVRTRPSQTPLLHYLVVWDADGHPDSFVVDSRNVTTLHRQFGQAMAGRARNTAPASRHTFTGK